MSALFHPSNKLRGAPTVARLQFTARATNQRLEDARDMHRALGLLLLATEGALAQSREPSRWDANVPAYGGIVDGCPCTADCTPNALETMEQASSNSVTATFDTRATLQFAYLTDEHGTIISYKAGDEAWNGALSTITFDWDASEQPTGVVPHIVYADSCADALYRNPDGTTVTSTWVRQGSHPPGTPQHARTPCSDHGRRACPALPHNPAPRITRRRCACHRSAPSWRS